MPMQISFTINRAGKTDLRPCSFTPIADDIVWHRALDTGEFLHYMHTTLLLGAGLWSSERPSRYYRENPSMIYVADQPQPPATKYICEHATFLSSKHWTNRRYCCSHKSWDIAGVEQWIHHHCAKVSCIYYPYHWSPGVLVAADIRSCRENCVQIRPLESGDNALLELLS